MEDLWSDADVVTLINFYEENTCLHDVTSAEYRNKVKKRVLEQQISDMLQKPGKQQLITSFGLV